MSVNLDINWLLGQAADEESRRFIDKINTWRDYVLKNNQFIKSKDLFQVNFKQRKIWFRENSAFSSIEVYQQIFRNNDHFLMPEFSGKDAKLVIDIGANEGYYTLKLKENNSGCKIIAVEPNPYNFEILERNLAVNKIKGVTLVKKAIGLKNGTMSMDIVREIGAIGSSDINMIQRAWMKQEFINKIQVETITLETLCKENNITNVDILKIDVEGMEAAILNNACFLLQETVHEVVLERHSKELRHKIYGIMQSIGFELVYEEDPLMEKYYGDMYFINKKLNNKLKGKNR